jgi:hypothetical protein
MKLVELLLLLLQWHSGLLFHPLVPLGLRPLQLQQEQQLVCHSRWRRWAAGVQ